MPTSMDQDIYSRAMWNADLENEDVDHWLRPKDHRGRA